MIIGAGLSGLYLAWRLHQQGRDVCVLEARERSGGRIFSPLDRHNNECSLDLGPAWIWPQLQPQMKQLIADLDVTLFKQFTDGAMLYESASGQIERYNGPSSHNQSYRVRGGCQALIHALQSRIPDSIVRLNTSVKSIDQESLTVEVYSSGEPLSFTADRIILTLPPRLLVQSILFNPRVDNSTIQLWKSIPTWMATHCKMLFVYAEPFWRAQGLSGEVFSHCGPLTEIYDGSSADGCFALTSFVGLSAQQRQQMSLDEIKQASLTQLHKLFGDEALNVLEIHIKDWSEDVYSSSDLDLNTASHHPEFPPEQGRGIFKNRIILAGTETARKHGGYLEGALESAEEALGLM